jgi:hypothetical protein
MILRGEEDQSTLHIRIGRLHNETYQTLLESCGGEGKEKGEMEI